MDEVEFAGQNLENNRDLADWTHPVELIEAEEDPEAHLDAEILRRVMAETFKGRSRRKLAYAAAFNKWVSLVWVVNPALLDGKSLTVLAEEIGVTRAALSAYATAWSDLLGGFRNGAMKSGDARKAYQSAQVGHQNYRTGRSNHGNARTQQRLDNLRRDFIEGRSWRRDDKELLRRRGLIGAGDQLTAEGKVWVRGGTHQKGTLVPSTHRG